MQNHDLKSRVVGPVSYSKDSAADDGDNGEDDGGTICI